jgi:hypothetical protein
MTRAKSKQTKKHGQKDEPLIDAAAQGDGYRPL